MTWPKEYLIPNRVVAVLGSEMGNGLSHSTIDTVFGESGFPGGPPGGNKTDKAQSWLRSANTDSSRSPLDALGELLGNLESRIPRDRGVGLAMWPRIDQVLLKEQLAFDGGTSVQRIDKVHAEEQLAKTIAQAPQASFNIESIFSEMFAAKPAPMSPTSTSVAARSTSVFVVHGHDHGLKNAVARFLTILGLSPVILHEQADKEETLIAKLKANGDVSFAVVLCTADDSVSTAKGQVARARQNVVLELGYFAGKLGLDSVCAIVDADLDMPSDLGGVIYAPRAEWQSKLLDRLTGAGFKFEQQLIATALRVR